MRSWILVSALAVLPGCGDDDDESSGDGDADADADVDADGDGDGDADADADGDADSICSIGAGPGRVELDLLVDGRRIDTCEEWRLRITACASPEYPVCTHGVCNRCESGDIPQDCDLGDACEDPTLHVETAGQYRICVTAELPNADLTHTTCTERLIVVNGERAPDPVELDIDTQDQFPCIRDWTYDGTYCCDVEGQGFCVPPGAF